MKFKLDDFLMGSAALGIAVWGVFNQAYFLTIFFGGILGSIATFKLLYNDDTGHRKSAVKLAGLAIALASTVSVFSYTVEAEPYVFAPSSVENYEVLEVTPYVDLEKLKPKEEIPVEKPNTYDETKDIKIVKDEITIIDIPEPIDLPEEPIFDEPTVDIEDLVGGLVIDEPIKVEKAKEVVEPEIFDFVEKMPEFTGGMKELLTYLGKNIKYPTLAKEVGIDGRVIVEFIVMEDGSIANAKVVRGIGGGCDEEALRVIKAMPNWQPGIQQGKAVRVKYKVPVRFKLQ